MLREQLLNESKQGPKQHSDEDGYLLSLSPANRRAAYLESDNSSESTPRILSSGLRTNILSILVGSQKDSQNEQSAMQVECADLIADERIQPGRVETVEEHAQTADDPRMSTVDFDQSEEESSPSIGRLLAENRTDHVSRDMLQFCEDSLSDGTFSIETVHSFEHSANLRRRSPFFVANRQGNRGRTQWCCCLTCCCPMSRASLCRFTCGVLSVLVLIVLLCAVFAPSLVHHLIEKSTQNSEIELISLRISDPSSTSIAIHSRFKLTNTGWVSATIRPANYFVYARSDQSGLSKIAVFSLPSIRTSDQGSTLVEFKRRLYIIDQRGFTEMTRRMVTQPGSNSTGLTVWIVSEVDIRVEHRFLHFRDQKTRVNKSVQMPIVIVEHFQSDNLVLTQATSQNISSVADISFFCSTHNSSVSSVSVGIDEDSEMRLYLPNSDIQIGRVYLGERVTLSRGMNTLMNRSIVIHRVEQNQGELDDFISEFVMGKQQTLLMDGPFRVDGQPSVLDGILQRFPVSVQGSREDPFAFGGAVTSETQTGWKAWDPHTGRVSKHVRGANVDVYNVFHLPLTLDRLSGDAFLSRPLQFRILNQDCPPSVDFARLSVGYGVNQSAPEQHTVQIQQRSRRTFFVIAQPMRTNHRALDVCFLAGTLAAICRDNPGLKGDIHSQLQRDHLTLRLRLNVSVLLDSQFPLSLRLEYDSFPLFFGYEVYAGYKKDLNLSCKNVNVIQ